ncbi:hypothetical protein FB561_3349 [Kribbella amoyensis]|uniref:DNA-directed RNA polymerase specialized sigma24 family protein n=1 Tax=Kribbella amoyensis TaxID=996641 RepID=A0A561BTS5_9ACTN|nr:hypothetical protein [Kribbella amoyensis]TWD82221.1 hypothetical protein FB561_3349 [Kribbella amoyensis]
MTDVQTLEHRSIGPAEAETALLENYAKLVRLAYLVLPPSLGRHRRILAAHGVVQHALPDRRKIERETADTSALSFLRRRVVQGAVRQSRSRTPLRLLPQVWGLRLFPKSGAADDLALDHALAVRSPEARAAWALVRAERLSIAEVEQELRAAGVRHPERAIAEAGELDEAAVAGIHGPLDAAVFDPCSVRLAPSDLMRRRARGRAVTICVTAVLVLAILLSLLVSGGRERAETTRVQSVQAPTLTQTTKLSPDALRRTGATRWQDTARVDFTAWPPRGGLVNDKALLARALDTWTAGKDVTAVVNTSLAAPTEEPQLLYAGEVDGKAVVVLHDGRRLARYTEGDGLVVARTDDADVTTAGAVALSRSAQGIRYLTAPWVATAGLRDLKKPDTPARDLGRQDGVTEPVQPPAANCSSWPALQLRSSSAVAEKHAFLLTDLGGLSPTHLTYMPPPSEGVARSPREATGGPALVSWSRTVCGLQTLQDKGIKTANNWVFAEQTLPDRTSADWVCTRSDSWEGSGWASVRLLPAGLVAGQATNTAICSRFDQNVLATTAWHAPSGGATYLLAAGSRHVDRIAVGPQTVQGRLVAIPGRTTAKVSAHLTNGTTIKPLNK